MAKKRIMAVRQGMWLISLLAVLSLVVACAKAAPTSTTSQASETSTSTTAVTSTTSQAPKPSTTTTTSSKPTAVTPTKWTAMVVTGPNDFTTKWAQEYAAEVKRRTEGRLDIQVLMPGELPLKGPDMLRAVRDNDLQISHVISVYVGGDAPLLLLIDLPGSIGVDDKQADIMEKAARPLVEAELEKRWNGILLGAVRADATQIWSKKPINSLDDLKGQKIRVSGAEAGEILKGLGVTPIFMSTAETAGALERGVIDGFTQATTMVGEKVDLIKYGYVINLMGTHPMYVVNRTALQRLSAADQKIVIDTGKYLEPQWAAWIRNYESKALADIKTKVKVGQATDAEMALLRKLGGPVQQAWAQKAGPEAATGLAAINKALGY